MSEYTVEAAKQALLRSCQTRGSDLLTDSTDAQDPGLMYRTGKVTFTVDIGLFGAVKVQRDGWVRAGYPLPWGNLSLIAFDPPHWDARWNRAHVQQAFASYKDLNFHTVQQRSY